MKWLRAGIASVFVLCAIPVAANSKSPVLRTSICEVLAKPAKFDRKWVQITGEIVHNPEFRAFRDPSGCGAIELMFAGEYDPMHRKVDFSLRRDTVWEKYESLVNAGELFSVSGGEVVFNHRSLYKVTATFIGRIDSAEIKDRKGKLVVRERFGHLNQFRARLVVRRVLKVAAIDAP